MKLCDECERARRAELYATFRAAKAPPAMTMLDRSMDAWIAEIGADVETLAGFARYVATAMWEVAGRPGQRD